ncbi:hypothetical protein GJ496_001719 [Pomphorhynchus laevis]|nr:hypothetical protein GJ496_001719 [Pomphorhynchus laevis]
MNVFRSILYRIYILLFNGNRQRLNYNIIKSQNADQRIRECANLSTTTIEITNPSNIFSDKDSYQNVKLTFDGKYNRNVLRLICYGETSTVDRRQEYFKSRVVHNSDLIYLDIRLRANLSPFLVANYKITTNNEKHLILTKFYLGNSLEEIMYERNYLSEFTSKLLAAQIILALQYLHLCKIALLVLSPRSVIINRKTGLLKLTDQMLSFQDPFFISRNDNYYDRIFALSEFADCFKWMCPHLNRMLLDSVIQCKKLDPWPPSPICDWWSLGMLTFFTCAGHHPVVGSSESIEIWTIINSKNFKYPAYFSEDLRYILHNLLLNRRCTHLSFKTVKSSTWFAEIDWNLLYDIGNNIDNHKLPDNWRFFIDEINGEVIDTLKQNDDITTSSFDDGRLSYTRDSEQSIAGISPIMADNIEELWTIATEYANLFEKLMDFSFLADSNVLYGDS